MVNRYCTISYYLNWHMLLRIVIRAQIRKHDIVIRAKNTLFLRITIMHVKTLDSSRRMFQCMFYDSHEKMYFHCDVFSIKTGYTIIRCLNSNVKYVVWSNIEGHLSNTSFSTCTRASNQLSSIFGALLQIFEIETSS